MSRALIFGVSGLIGSSLAPLLLKEYDEVIAPVRRPHGNNDERLKTPIIDFEKITELHELFAGVDVLYYCLGTTRKKAGSFNNFQSIEWSLATSILSTAKTHNISNVVLLSSRGANPNSFVGYLRIKGQIERFAVEQNFDQLIIARPSLLMGERGESRLFEGLSVSLSRPILKPLQKLLPSSAPIQDHKLALALIKATKTPLKKRYQVIENKELISFAL